MLAILMLVSLCSCSSTKGSNTYDDDDKETKKSKATGTNQTEVDEVSNGIEILRKYLKEEGANYQGVYKMIYLDTDSDDYTEISCDQDGTISFYNSHEKDGKDTTISMELYEGSVTQSLTFLYEQDGYTCISTGTIYTELISSDDCSVYGINFREDFPSSVSNDQIEDLINGLFPACANVMFAYIDLMLIKYVGIQLKDLGFSNW